MLNLVFLVLDHNNLDFSALNAKVKEKMIKFWHNIHPGICDPSVGVQNHEIPIGMTSLRYT